MRIRIFKYSLQSLLFAVLCAGGLMAAYRAGADRGYAAGQAKWRGEQYLPRAYFVRDLAGPDGNYSTQEIEKAITQVDPTIWDVAGGPAHLQVLVDRDRNPVFVISADAALHERIGAFLEELRAGDVETTR